MAVKPIPKGYHSVTTYIVVPGVAKLLDFLKQSFGAKERGRFARPDGGIMHAEVKIGNSVVMMGEPMDRQTPMPACIYLYVKDADAVYRRALEAGASSVAEPADQFYGDRRGGIKDPFGNQWWIATHTEDVAPEEMQRRSEAVMKQAAGQ